jgi:hypothetical protein
MRRSEGEGEKRKSKKGKANDEERLRGAKESRSELIRYTGPPTINI